MKKSREFHFCFSFSQYSKLFRLSTFYTRVVFPKIFSSLNSIVILCFRAELERHDTSCTDRVYPTSLVGRTKATKRAAVVLSLKDRRVFWLRDVSMNSIRVSRCSTPGRVSARFLILTYRTINADKQCVSSVKRKMFTKTTGWRISFCSSVPKCDQSRDRPVARWPAESDRYAWKPTLREIDAIV